jgi:putative methionine-R-sulfoxide reductase with GAF domain
VTKRPNPHSVSVKKVSPFQLLKAETQREVALAGGSTEALFQVLVHTFERYIRQVHQDTSFIGVYILHKDILVLGPHVGPPTVHDIIPISRGVVGKCAEDGKIINVADVSACMYYLSCCPTVQSEIALPILSSNSETIGVLDLDSDVTRAYKPSDEKQLREFADLLVQPAIKIADRLRLVPDW